MRWNFPVLLTLLALFATSCGGGGPTTPPLPSLGEIKFNPSSGRPGTSVKVSCAEINESFTEVYLSFDQIQMPALSFGNGWVSFYTPPLPARTYSITLLADGRVSNPAQFSIELITNLPYTQTEFAQVLSEALGKINGYTHSSVREADTNFDLYTDAEMLEINEFFAGLAKICNEIQPWILELPAHDAELFQSYLYESGVLTILNGFRTGASENGTHHGQAFHAKHQYLYDADNFSMIITSCKFVFDTAALASLIVSGGTAAPALPVKLGVDLVLIAADWSLDTLIPTDLDWIEIQLDKEMDLGQVQYPKFIGHFRCQNNAQASSFQAILDIFFASLPATVDVSTKEAVTQAILLRLQKLGIDTHFMDEMMAGKDGPYVADLPVELDMALYNLDLGEAINKSCPFVPLAKFFKFLETIGWNPPILRDSVLIDNPEILSWDYDTEILLTKAVGQTQLQARGYCMDSYNFWLFKLELQTPFEASPAQIIIQTTSENLSGIWKGYWKNDEPDLNEGSCVLTITQTGNLVTGIVEEKDKYGDYAIYKINGSISDNKFKYHETLLFSVHDNTGYWCFSCDSTFPYYPPTTVLDGTYYCTGDCDGITGTEHLEKQ